MSSSSAMCGNATFTIDPSRMIMSCATAMTASIRQRFESGAADAGLDTVNLRGKVWGFLPTMATGQTYSLGLTTSTATNRIPRSAKVASVTFDSVGPLRSSGRITGMTSRIPEKATVDGLEDRWAEVWEQQGTYSFDRTKALEQVYSIDTPPPTVS